MKTRCTLVIVATLLMAAMVVAQPAPPARHGGGAQALAKYLALTTEQISAWQQIAKDTAATIKPLAENARDLQTQLDTALNVATPDPLAVGKLAVSLHSVRQQIRAAEESAKTKRLALLTADQKVKFEAFQAANAFLHQRRPGMAARHAPMMGR